MSDDVNERLSKLEKDHQMLHEYLLIIEKILANLQALLDHFNEYIKNDIETIKQEENPWINRWPSSPIALFKDINGIECIDRLVDLDDYCTYEFPHSNIDVKRIVAFKEIGE